MTSGDGVEVCRKHTNGCTMHLLMCGLPFSNINGLKFPVKNTICKTLTLLIIYYKVFYLLFT